MIKNDQEAWENSSSNLENFEHSHDAFMAMSNEKDAGEKVTQRFNILFLLVN